MHVLHAYMTQCPCSVHLLVPSFPSEQENRSSSACMQVRRAEKAKLMDAPPGSIDDFERLVLQSANSSRLWIMYMAFLLSMQEVGKAREVAERALRTIDYRCVNPSFFVYLVVC